MDPLHRTASEGFESLVDHVSNLEYKFSDDQFPKVSVLVPTFDCSPKISITIQSILTQRYPSFEVIVIDANSKDRTIQTIHGFHDDRIIVHSVEKYHLYDMLNVGIALAQGEYINILFPGDFYTYSNALRHVMGEAIESHRPHLLFSGTLLREGHRDPKMMYRSLCVPLLLKGQQPTSLQACWFRADTFQMIGPFDPSYHLRGGFDLFCRYCLRPGMATRSIKRVLTDYDLRFVTSEAVYFHFVESFRIIKKYFGTMAALRWLGIQKDTSRLFGLWFKKVKMAFLGR